MVIIWKQCGYNKPVTKGTYAILKNLKIFNWRNMLPKFLTVSNYVIMAYIESFCSNTNKNFSNLSNDFSSGLYSTNGEHSIQIF